MSKLPNFVMMGSETALRLVENDYGSTHLYRYYRDGGDWYTNVIEKNGKLFTSSHVSSINGIELVPTTEEKWAISNGDYTPVNFKRYGLDTVSFGSNPCAEIAMPTEIKNNYKYLLIRR